MSLTRSLVLFSWAFAAINCGRGQVGDRDDEDRTRDEDVGEDDEDDDEGPADDGEPEPSPQPPPPDDDDEPLGAPGGAAGTDGEGGRAGQAGGSPDAGSPADAAAPAARDAATMPGAACDFAFEELALYQGVRTSLWRLGMPVANKVADVVQNRPGLFRVFVRPGATWNGREVTARLTLTSAAGTRTFDDRRAHRAVSGETMPASTFNFEVPAGAIGAGAEARVELVDAGCGARLPATGNLPLGARRTGTLKVRLVPIRYDADNSGRLPDTSAAQIERMRGMIMAMFPVEAVDITVRTVVGTRTTLAPTSGWPETLDGLRNLRAQDGAANDVYYYGVVNPANTMEAYCGNACTAGIAYVAGVTAAQVRAGLGLGYTGNGSADTMTHELGHELGRQHAPCGRNVAGVDMAFPDKMGGIGAWGYDLRSKTLLDPAPRKDIMSYCYPHWVSDYTYRALLERNAAVNGVTPALVETEEHPALRYRVLLVDAAGGVRWGLTFPNPVLPDGTPEDATVQDRSGREIARITVYRTPIEDGGGSTVLVPPPRPGWAFVELRGSTPIAFDQAPGVRPLE